MKSNLLSKKWLACAVLLSMTVALSDGCKKKPENPETVSLKGMWYSNDQWFGTEHDRAAMDFVNSNTLIWYGTVSTNKNAFQDMEGISLDGCAGWYYFSKTYYTYVLADNKIVFNDRIFTVFENYLVEDGFSLQWMPWDDGNDTPPTVTVTTLNPKDITSTTATCGAEVTTGNSSNLKELGVCWGTTAYPTIEANHLSTTTCNAPFVCTISNLTPETKYHVRAYVKNGNNYVYGDDKSFTTLAEGGGGEENCTITVTANPTNGGSVSGGGTYQLGEQCTITATPNMGYSFVNWTWNGNVVSESATYTFTVLGSLDMVANFVYQVSEHYTINVSANPSIGGSVSGSGTYQQGQICTVNAVASMGYSFVNWTENGVQCSMDASYTFIVNGNRELVANFMEESQAPEGAINGVFSVSESQRVYFSQGNLQYKASNGMWRFAENQYDCIGTGNTHISSTYNDWIDLFGWGTSGWNCGNTYYHPWDYYNAESLYGPPGNNDFTGIYLNSDWGQYNAISNGGNTSGQWRTMSRVEWDYVFNKRRPQSGIRFAKARVNNVDGVILVPDNWSAETYDLKNTNSSSANYTSNSISSTQWNILQEAGVVFLPAAGRRYGTDLIWENGSVGYYWSASHVDLGLAYCLQFSKSEINAGQAYNRAGGLSVRLVCRAE